MRFAIVGAGSIGGTSARGSRWRGKMSPSSPAAPTSRRFAATASADRAGRQRASKSPTVRAIGLLGMRAAARWCCWRSRHTRSRRSPSEVRRAARPADLRGHPAERHSLVVLLSSWRPVRGPCGARGRSGRQHRDPHRERAHHRYRRVSGTELIAPGVIRVIEGNRFTLGEPDGSKSERVQALSEALTRAGFKAPVCPISATRSGSSSGATWCSIPSSALSHATLAAMGGFAPTRALGGRNDAGDPARRRAARRRVSGSASSAHRRTPWRLATTRPRCCRTSKPAARWNSRRWSAPWSKWRGWWRYRRRTSMPSMPSRACWPGRCRRRTRDCS